MTETCVKDAFAKLDEDLAALLMEAAQFALNDKRTVKRLAKELSLSELQLEVLAGLAIEISNSAGGRLLVNNMAELAAKTEEYEELKSALNRKYDQVLADQLLR